MFVNLSRKVPFFAAARASPQEAPGPHQMPRFQREPGSGDSDSRSSTVNKPPFHGVSSHERHEKRAPGCVGYGK